MPKCGCGAHACTSFCHCVCLGSDHLSFSRKSLISCHIFNMTHVYHSNLFTQQTSYFQDGAISHIFSEEIRYPAFPVKSEATV